MTSRNKLSQSWRRLTPQLAPDDSPPPVPPSASVESAGLPPPLASASSSSTEPPQPSSSFSPTSASTAETPGDGQTVRQGFRAVYDEPKELAGRQGSSLKGLALCSGARDDSKDREELPGATATAELPRAAPRTAHGRSSSRLNDGTTGAPSQVDATVVDVAQHRTNNESRAASMSQPRAVLGSSAGKDEYVVPDPRDLDGIPAPAPSAISPAAADKEKLRVLQEKLSSDEASAREVFGALASTFLTKELLALLGKEYRGYLLAKLNFDGGDTLSKDLENFRRSKELKQLTDSSKKWMEEDQFTAEEKEEERVRDNFVDFMMDALKVASTNVHALRIFTGFFVHFQCSKSKSKNKLKKDQCIQLLVDLKIVATGDAIRDAIDKKRFDDSLRFLTLHLTLDRLYGSDIGSASVNLRFCRRAEGEGKKGKEQDTNDRIRYRRLEWAVYMNDWCWNDWLSDHLLGLDRVPGCEPISGRSSIRAPCSSEEWTEALQAAHNYLRELRRGAIGPADEAVACAPRGETIEHFIALDKHRAIADVVNQSGCLRSPTANAIRGRDFADYPAEVLEIYPSALGFVMHSPKFLEWTKEYLGSQRVKERGEKELGENAIVALNLAVSEAEGGAHTGDIDPKFSGRMIMIDSLRASSVLDTGRIKTRDDGSFGALVSGASRECPQYRLVMKFEVMLHDQDLIERFFPSLLCMSALVSCPNVARLYSYDSFTVPPQGIHCTDETSRFTRKAEHHIGTVVFMEAGGDTLRTELDNRNKRKLVSAEDVEDVVIITLKNGVQILNGLEAIHKMNREHRAIKPENVVRGHHGQLQLMDLGMCRMETSQEWLDFGPSMYGYNRQYDSERPPKCFFDVFSAGVILHESICGYRPDQRAHEEDAAKHLARVADSDGGKKVLDLSKDMRDGRHTAETAKKAAQDLLNELNALSASNAS